MTKGRKKPNTLPRQKVLMPITSEKQVRVVRSIPEYVPLQYADALMVQMRDTMFTVSFLQTQYPLALTPEDIRELKEIEQRCVAQLIITPPQMARNLSVLNKHFKEFIEAQDPETQEHLKDLLNGKNEANETVETNEDN